MLHLNNEKDHFHFDCKYYERGAHWDYYCPDFMDT